MPIADWHSFEENVRDFLEAEGVGFVSKIQVSESVGYMALHVSSDRVGARASGQKTSRKQMRELRDRIREEVGVEVSWIIENDRDIEEAEDLLILALRRRFGGRIDSVLVSAPEVTPASVWVYLGEGAEIEKERIQRVVDRALNLIEWPSSVLYLVHHEDAPPNAVMILRQLKRVSPTSGAELAKVLRAGGMNVPNVTWLKRRLDTMRRKGLLVYLENGQYALTEAGLSEVPRSTRRASSDVDRVLALARRKW